MVKKLTRRRFIQLAAISGAAAIVPNSARALLDASVPMARWQGIALGAESQLTLAHPDKAFADKIIQQCVTEIDRLESIFSLYRPNSSVSQLNANGILDNAPPELQTVIRTAMEYGERSGGVFDITIQPLWVLYHQHFMQKSPDPEGPASEQIDQALLKVGYQKIDLSNHRIYMPEGMQITLNGIAQGYITDRVTELLRHNGFEQALINLGEYQALGQHPDRRMWDVAVSSPGEPWKILDTLNIPSGKALATSGACGTRWSDKSHHLLSPKTGRSVITSRESISVIADRAMHADAIATTLCLLPSSGERHAFLQHCPAAGTVYL